MQSAISDLLVLTPKLSDDMSEEVASKAEALINAVTQPVSREEIEALISLLPAGGDMAYGLNWSILHIIEAAPEWPIWDFLEDREHEWIERLLVGLVNGGHTPPERT